MLLTLVGAELLLRALGPTVAASDRRGLHQLRPDRPWLYGMVPGARGTLDASGGVVYQINSDGFRDALYERPKPSGVFRIIVLGDSVAFGYGVSLADTFPKRMEAALRDAAGPQRIEVLNFGVSGYNPYTEAELLYELLPRYQPDLVLVQFCINDLNDPTLHFDVQTRQHLGAIPDAAYPDPSVRRAPATPPGPLLRLCRRSRLCSRVDEALLAARASEPERAQQEGAAVPVEGRTGPEWPWLARLYGEMAAASREAGARFAVVAFPYPAQLDARGPHPVQEELLAIGRRGGWPVVDLLGPFRGAAARGTPLFLDWWHPTPAGHALAADETLVQLACGGLLPPGLPDRCRD